MAVQGKDLPPVGVGRPRGVGVHRGDGRLDLIGARMVAAQALPDQLVPFDDHRTVPGRPILIGQQHHRSVGCDARSPPGVGEQQQRQESQHFALVGHQVGEQPGQPDGFEAEVLAHQRLSCGRGMALVEHQVDDGQDGSQTIGKLGLAGDSIRKAGRLDLLLGPHDALRDGGFRHQEGSGDLRGLQASEQPQGQCNLGSLSQSRVATGEDQPEPVVGHCAHRLGGFGVLQEHCLLVPIMSGRLPPQMVDGPVAGGGGDPGSRIRG